MGNEEGSVGEEEAPGEDVPGPAPVKPVTVLSTVKKDHRIWVERDPNTGNVTGYAKSLSNKVGKRLPIQRAMLGIGDEEFALKVAKDFKKWIVRSLGRRQAAAPMRR